MDLKKITEDFEKRYGEKPESLFFCGKPIIFFKSPGLLLGAGISVGGYIATKKRCDGRIQLGRRDSNHIFSVNTDKLEIFRGEKICDLLQKLKDRGNNPRGGDILIYENTDYKLPDELLLLCAQSGFCENPQPAAESVIYFENYEENMISLTAKTNRITAFSGGETEYLPFHNQKCKIVISEVTEKKNRAEYPEDLARDAKDALCMQDMEKFGALLSKSTGRILEKSCAKNSRDLFKTATDLGDCLGSGLLPAGGIFSIVENDRIDTFIHNLGSVYRKHFGGRPEFYITKTEDSGIRLPLPE